MSSQDLNVQAAELIQLNAAYELQNILLRMQKNLALIGNADNSQLLRIANANLYQLAAQYYNDWTLWQTIADANNLTDFIVPGLVILTIPPKPTNPVNNS